MTAAWIKIGQHLCVFEPAGEIEPVLLRRGRFVTIMIACERVIVRFQSLEAFLRSLLLLRFAQFCMLLTRNSLPVYLGELTRLASAKFATKSQLASGKPGAAPQWTPSARVCGDANESIIAEMHFSRTTILRVRTANRLVWLFLTVLPALFLTSLPAIAEKNLNEAIEEIFDTKTQDSHKFERWFHLYSQGKVLEADKVWSVILKENTKTPSIANFLENINGRCWFAEDEKTTKGAKKVRLDATQIYEHLLACTQKELGEEHRFCADFCKFLAMYAESNNDFNTSKIYRLRECRLREKWLGPKHEITLLSMLALAKLQIKMKEYEDVEALLKKVIARSDELRTPKRYHDGIKMYIEFLKRTGRDTDARRVIAKYKTYMWTR
jgi:hypothetical protein